jgi:uncharacterized repeat protein (TIGR03803 family)
MAQRHHRAFLQAALLIGLISPALAQEAPPMNTTADERPIIDVIPSEPPAARIEPAVSVLTTLYRFPGGANGYSPRGGVAMDPAGDIYGTTQYDGFCSTCGLIYKLIHPAAGKTVWTYKVLHRFSLNPTGGFNEDGIHPTAPLTYFKGAFYGTASAGGDTACGCGIVFKITPNGVFTRLHTFDPISGKNGTTPIGGLLIDSNGIMYGTTEGGGVHHSGIIYKLSVNGGGFTILHHFAGNYTSGPQGEMIFGRDGAIYGTTYGGGRFNQGAVFRITKAGVYQDIYDFKGVNQPGGSHDGANPEGRLALGADGTIYGTTSFGGSPSGYGTAWSLKKIGTKWIYTQLYIFGSPGNLPHSGLVKAPGGYYGTGAGGGKYQEGVIYKLVPPVAPSKKWTYVLLHSFNGRNVNGNIPYGVLLYAKSMFYGMNLLGGHVTSSGECNSGCGTVFQFKP